MTSSLEANQPGAVVDPGRGSDPLATSWVEVDLGAVTGNFARAVDLAGHGGYAVVKADAYGHGAVEVARSLERAFAPGEEERLQGFCVARQQEAERLRQCGVRSPILTFGSFPSAMPPSAQRALVTSAFELDWEPVVSSLADLDFWLRTPKERRPLLHLEVDSGMQRTGITLEDVGEAASALRAGLRLGSVFSHFVDSEVPGAARAAEQEAQFADAVLQESDLRQLKLHVDNSAGLRRERRQLGEPASRQDPSQVSARRSFRLGGGLYGLDLAAESGAERLYRPAMRVMARLLQVRKAREGSTVGYSGTFLLDESRWIGTLAIGYADGLPRSWKHGAVVFEGERRARPVVGRISMDLTTVDLGPVGRGEAPVALGTPATVVSGCDGRRADDLARSSGSLSYEITCRFGARLPRVFVGAS